MAFSETNSFLGYCRCQMGAAGQRRQGHSLWIDSCKDSINSFTYLK